MLLDFNGHEILNLQGNKLNMPMARYVAEMMVDPKQTTKYSAIRTYEIARKIMLEGSYDTIESDYSMIYDLVEHSDMWGSLVRGQILLFMGETKKNYEEMKKAEKNKEDKE